MCKEKQGTKEASGFFRNQIAIYLLYQKSLGFDEPRMWIRKSYDFFFFFFKQCLDAGNPESLRSGFISSLGAKDKITGIKVFSHNLKFVKDKSSYYFHRNLTYLIITFLNIACILHRLCQSDKAVRYFHLHIVQSWLVHIFIIFYIIHKVNQQLKNSSLKYIKAWSSKYYNSTQCYVSKILDSTENLKYESVH